MKRFSVFLVSLLLATGFLNAQTIGGSVYGGGRMATVSGNAKVQLVNGTVTQSVYGGNDISGATNNGANSVVAVADATSEQITNGEFYGVLITGGTVGDVFGGANGYYACHAAETTSEGGFASINYTGENFTIEDVSGKKIPAINKTSVFVNGGTVTGSVYGGGNLAPIGYQGITSSNGSVRVKAHQGTIQGNLFTGGNMASVYVPTNLTVNNEIGTTNTYDALTINGGVYGGNDKSGTIVSASNTIVTIEGAPTIGDVFGGGNGDYDYNQPPLNICGGLPKPDQTVGTQVNINTEGGYINRVFGGGNSASVAYTTVTLNATGTGAGTNGLHVGTVYGGCNKADVLTLTNVTLKNQTKVATIYGGCNISGDIGNSASVSVTGGTLTDNLFGGANGYYGCPGAGGFYAGDFDETDGVEVNSTIKMPTVRQTIVSISGGTIGSDTKKANVYGGGNMAAVGSTAVTGSATLSILPGATIKGNVYGGGNMATVYGASNFSISGGRIDGNVFGGNDKSGSVTGTGRSGTASDGTTLSDDNAAAYVSITSNPIINGAVFGGGNGDYTYYTDRDAYNAALEANKVFACSTEKPVQSTAFVDVHTGNTSYIAQVFGGGNNATVEENANVCFNAVDLVSNSSESAHVGAIFGGNNKASMGILPNIKLMKGTVVNVYGGGNQGDMTGMDMEHVHDIAGNLVPFVSTYVKIDNATNVHISGTLYGGCNQADVTSTSYVDIRGGEIENLYGGNDMAGTVYNARVDVSGGTIENIFGGSNGDYNYSAGGNAEGLTRPLCEATDVNIWGGTINSNIYAGGNAGDCTDTYLEIDDSKGYGTASVSGRIFGGAKGKRNCNPTIENPRVGNVFGTATTELKHLTNLSDATVYGGGDAGNVCNTQLTLYSTWDDKFDAIYGGCNAADVTGTAHTVIMPRLNTVPTAEVVYGGNDVAGIVANTLLEVNGGQYANLYGGGNGTYDYVHDYPGCSVPISEDVTVVINDGDFTANVYGGGNLGKCGKTAMIASPHYELDPAAYGRISLNVHGGTYANHIFTGGKGNATSGQVVYGLKQLNMDGGTVARSVYGGSELVTDGYTGENILDSTEDAGVKTYFVKNFTLRPSTIMNIVGGTIMNNVYGGGYLGTIYGSVYVNIGKQAVDECLVWTYQYKRMVDSVLQEGDNPLTYASFKPVWVAGTATTEANKLVTRDLYLEKSVFNGSDWGDAGENAVFDTRGFVGGESYIIVDGQGYNTHFTSPGAYLPSMNIAHSLYGSGTSCEGGDKGRHIRLFNYGEYKCANNVPNLSKELKSIQRADDALIHHSYVRFTGTQDNYSAYVSSTYSISRVEDWQIKGNTFLAMAAPTMFLAKISFLNEDGTVNNNRSDMRSKAHSSGCNLANELCSLIPQNAPYPMLFIEDGVYVDVIKSLDNDLSTARYGEIAGYAYLLAAAGTRANVISRLKTNTDNPTDGGFFFICNDSNSYHPQGEEDYEYPYLNYSSGYRSWSTGESAGSRKRQVTIVAHANVNQLASNHAIPLQPISAEEPPRTYSDFAYATARLNLPPTKPGHYYNITGINVDLSNGGQLILSKETYDPDDAASTPAPIWRQAEPGDLWKRASIADDPTYTFGLLFKLSNNFSTITTGYAHDEGRQRECVVWGNNNFNALDGFFSTGVVDGAAPTGGRDNIIPSINFYLTYSTQFSSTILRDVIFTMMEKDANGNDVAPINVTVTISTIVSQFKDETFQVMAMYNDGITNEFTHKVLLPATLNKRELYLSRIQWENSSTNPPGSPYFNMVDAITSTDADALNNMQFGMSVQLSEDLTSTINSTLGWYEREKDPINLYTKAGYSSGNQPTADITLTGTYGWLVGTLDGRSPAAVNVTLWYNGMEVFPLDKVIGTVTLTFTWRQGIETGNFNFICHVKTRQKGDTIYIATAPSVTRNGCTVTPWAAAYEPGSTAISNSAMKGKTPNNYVQSFADALSQDVYQEGDVLCVLDEVKIGYMTNVVIRGGEFGMLQLVRYTGRHYEFPGEACSYRGPMLSLEQDGKLSCYNMRIDGSGICKKLRAYTQAELTAMSPEQRTALGEQCYTAGKTSDVLNTPTDGGYYFEHGERLFDTCLVAGPIFKVKESATLTLADKVMMLHNFNKVAAVNTTLSQYDGGGAIVVEGGYNYSQRTSISNPALVVTKTATPTLNLNNNIEIVENGVLHANGTHSANANQGAAIYSNGGTLVVGNYADGAVINILNNYYANNWNTELSATMDAGKPTSAFTWTHPTSHAAQRNNIYLTRQATASPDPDPLVDKQSDLVQFLTDINTPSKVGVTKWFPGEDCRDTIRVSKVGITNQLYSTHAYERNVFVSDSSQYTIFYHPSIEPYTIYLHRCATFKKQVAGQPLYADVSQRSPLEYRANLMASCPNKVDTLIFNLHGGFYPYVFSWMDTSISAHTSNLLVRSTTSYNNVEVNADTSHQKALESNSNRFLMENMDMDYSTNSDVYNYKVTASDLAGCEQSRFIQVKVVKTRDASYDGSDFIASATSVNVPGVVTDNMAASDNTSASKALHVYKGININSRVLPGDANTTITGEIDGNVIANFDYQATGHDKLAFCEGDQIDLYTVSTNPSKRFVMWDFDPNAPQGDELDPVQYVVTGTDNTVLQAIYGASDYWKDAVNEHADTKISDGPPPTYGYNTNYNGSVHITSKEGLAWLISVVNGLNYQTANSFVFDTIYLDNVAAATWDMSEHLWTPIGTPNHPFRGRFIVPKNLDDVSDNDLIISGITVNEPNMQQVGFFGMIDTAQVRGLRLENVTINGAQFGGAVVGVAKDAVIKSAQVIGTNSIVASDFVAGGMLGRSSKSVLDSNKVTETRLVGSTIYGGGMLGSSNGDEIKNSEITNVNMNRMTAVYGGGIAGEINGDDVCPFVWDAAYEYTIVTPTASEKVVGVWIDTRDSSVWLNTLVSPNRPYGQSDSPCDPCPFVWDTKPHQYTDAQQQIQVVRGAYIDTRTDEVLLDENRRPRPDDYTPCQDWPSEDDNQAPNNNAKSLFSSSHVENNMVNFIAPKSALFSGGLAGTATNTHIQNNYTYGKSEGTIAAGALVGRAVEEVDIKDCYFLDGTANEGVGIGAETGSVDRVNRFRGAGNQVLVDSVSGVNNLTRLLNRWVRQRGADKYRTWRSALGDENNGYPVFGEPDFIPVRDTMNRTVCDFFSWNGSDYTETGVYSQFFHDTVEYIDSTMTLFLTVNESMLTEFFDSAAISQDYSGHGFFVSATELGLLRSTVEEFGSATLLLSDTLSTSHGCDSTVQLHLIVYQDSSSQIDPVLMNDVKVFPNPTTHFVNVVAEGMTEVEVYDNVSRKVLHMRSDDDRCTINLSELPAGYYYLRIHTSHGLIIKKIVKR